MKKMLVSIVICSFVFGLLFPAGCDGPVKQREEAKTKVGMKYEHRRKWDFEKDAPGSVPRGWIVAETNGRGKSAAWRVVGEPVTNGATRAIAITSTANTGRTYNLLIANDSSYRDFKLQVLVKAISGSEDQGGGAIWRAKDPNNYYIARWNPLENNFRVYFVKDSRRTQLATADAKLDTANWHKLEIYHKDNRIRAVLDGAIQLSVEDSTFTETGMVGLWTKADAATAFDDIEVEQE